MNPLAQYSDRDLCRLLQAARTPGGRTIILKELAARAAREFEKARAERRRLRASLRTQSNLIAPDRTIPGYRIDREWREVE